MIGIHTGMEVKEESILEDLEEGRNPSAPKAANVMKADRVKQRDSKYNLKYCMFQPRVSETEKND